MSKNVLLPYSFLVDVFRLIIHLSDLVPDDYSKFLCDSLESRIYDKISALDRRESFTRYKVAPPGSDVRESLRREYLDITGIHKDWTSDKEISL